MFLTPSQFRDIVSGRRRGPLMMLLRGGLSVVSFFYAIAMRLRNRRYDRGSARIGQAGAPVISVGNLTLGGTGKTPMVEWICRQLRAEGLRVAILSRGYGAEATGANDEALELENRLPDVPHLQNPDRLAAAAVAVEELDMQVLVLDDAFQHRRIARDLDLVMLDALEPLGFGRVFPRGTLREPASGLRRADVLVLSRADMVEEDAPASIRRRATELAPDALWVETSHGPKSLVDYRGTQSPLTQLADKRLAAFCGIGTPEGFRHTLAACGLEPVDLREFPDHHAYDRADVASLAAWAEEIQAEALVCTEKDLVKLGVGELGGRPLLAVRIGLDILQGEDELIKRLATVMQRVVGHEEATDQ